MDFLMRLEKEESELTEKATKLESFIDTKPYHALDFGMQALLKVQLAAMKTYLTCLSERIKLLI